ncbi:unnamed protein product, partial [Ectocarpus sp. 12 AP-2014]
MDGDKHPAPPPPRSWAIYGGERQQQGGGKDVAGWLLSLPPPPLLAETESCLPRTLPKEAVIRVGACFALIGERRRSMEALVVGVWVYGATPEGRRPSCLFLLA